MHAQTLPNPHADSDFLEQLAHEERQLLAGFRRLGPTQRSTLLELVDYVVEGKHPAGVATRSVGALS